MSKKFILSWNQNFLIPRLNYLILKKKQKQKQKHRKIIETKLKRSELLEIAPSCLQNEEIHHETYKDYQFSLWSKSKGLLKVRYGAK